jgi:hypothetical protein
VKLRYTGSGTVTFFTAGVGEVEPGAVFTVPDDIAPAFTVRGDIEKVPDKAPTEERALFKKKTAVGATPDPLPESALPTPAADTETS